MDKESHVRELTTTEHHFHVRNASGVREDDLRLSGGGEPGVRNQRFRDAKVADVVLDLVAKSMR
ncbi:MAG: hypothetical protein EA403_17465, partial [Spirochaetaceae bacterium]